MSPGLHIGGRGGRIILADYLPFFL